MESQTKGPTMHLTRLKALAIAVGVSVAVSACGGAAATTSTTATGTASVTESTATTEAGSSGAATVSANTASAAEIAAALTTAGVDNADRWAREVIEYRPYDTGDPDLAKLRQELAKYNPAPGVVDQIVSALTP